MIQHFAGIFHFPILRPGIFKIANALFFLCVNRDNRFPILQILMGSMVDKFKLFIAVRAWYANLLHFLVHLFAVAHIR